MPLYVIPRYLSWRRKKIDGHSKVSGWWVFRPDFLAKVEWTARKVGLSNKQNAALNWLCKSLHISDISTNTSAEEGMIKIKISVFFPLNSFLSSNDCIIFYCGVNSISGGGQFWKVNKLIIRLHKEFPALVRNKNNGKRAWKAGGKLLKRR